MAGIYNVLVGILEVLLAYATRDQVLSDYQIDRIKQRNSL